jgi:hypothetical protein
MHDPLLVAAYRLGQPTERRVEFDQVRHPVPVAEIVDCDDLVLG